jgi:GNAT superfamily N-acetyltransferase
VIVRPVLEGEYDALGDLTVAAYRAIPGAPQEAVDDYEHELRDVASRVSAGAEVAVAIAPDGTLAGGVTFVPDHANTFAEFEDPDAAGFRMLAVSPAHQGSGAGSALTDWCVDRALDAGRKRLILHTTQWMTTAHRIYVRAGFERTTALDWEPFPGFLLMAFVKELP